METYPDTNPPIKRGKSYLKIRESHDLVEQRVDVLQV